MTEGRIGERFILTSDKVPSMYATVEDFLKGHPEIMQARKDWAARNATEFAELSVILSENRLPAGEQVERISGLTKLVDSVKRLPLFLDIATHIIQAETFWPAFHGVWPNCDRTWSARDKLHRTLTRFSYRPPCSNLLNENADFFKALPTSISIHRGCSRGRTKGFSWTTDHQIAVGFSIGHRGIKVPNPVVCSATIRKCDVFSASRRLQKAAKPKDRNA